MIQIGIDFQGWPINALTLRDFLLQLGFKEDNGKFHIDNEELLNAYLLDLEDDGMGYGVNPKFIVEANPEVYKERITKLKVFNIFRDVYRD